MCGGFEHGVFARYLIGKGGYFELFFYAPKHVQIGHAGFDHHHICAFGNVKRYFAQCLVAVGGVHLVGVFVALAQIARAAHRVAKRAVKAAGVFGAVGHDAGVDVPAGI